jgi:hypothetical protein
LLTEFYPHGLIRLGLQPGEALKAPFSAGVEDTWTAMCLGHTERDWRQAGFGEEMLRQWVLQRKAEARHVAWDLITVAWDYTAKPHGESPGYDDAAKNMALPAGRNRIAASDILQWLSPALPAGFSSDLFILQVNSANASHDGLADSFYQTLREGRPYAGYYAAPLREVAAVFKAAQSGKLGSSRTSASGKTPPWIAPSF